MFIDILHSIKYNVKFFWVQCVKHKGLLKSFLQCGLLLSSLFVTGWLEFLLFVPVSESFGANRCSRASLLVSFDDFGQIFDVVIIFGSFWVVLWSCIIILSWFLLKKLSDKIIIMLTPPFEFLCLWTSFLKNSNSFLSFSLTIRVGKS
jgi:hypothetical protein